MVLVRWHSAVYQIPLMGRQLMHPRSGGDEEARSDLLILVGLLVGIAYGYFFLPSHAAAMKAVAKLFIRLIKMLVAPIIFSTLVVLGGCWASNTSGAYY